MKTVSVREAAQVLSVTERSVLNLLKKKALSGRKVGKSWSICAQSLEGLVKPERLTRGTDGSLGSVHAGSEGGAQARSARGLGSLAGQGRGVRGFTRGSKWPKGASESNEVREAKSDAVLSSLRAFQICQKVLWKDAVARRVFEGRVVASEESLQSWRLHCRPLRLGVAEELGAGFVSYGAEKQACYARSRAALGRLLAYLEISLGEAEACKALGIKDMKLLKGNLEQELLPALVALHRMVSRRDRRAAQ